MEWEGFLVVSDLPLTKHYAIGAPFFIRGIGPGVDPGSFPASTYQLVMVGLTRFELVTPRLSSVCSNQLSYRPGVSHTNKLSKNAARAGSLKTR